MKAIEYSLRYMVIIVALYYLIPMSFFYKLSFAMIGIIPLNFLAIKYGIYNKIDKDNYVTKYYILMSLVVYTTLFNVIFLILNKVNFIVIIFTVIINGLELIFLDNTKKDRLKIQKNR